MKTLRSLLFLACMLGLPGVLRAQTATLFTVEENGPRSERINIVFLSEGYTTADMPNFAGHVANAVNFLFSKEPWQQYRSYCNVYRIEIASNQSGCDYGNTSGVSGTRDTYFNAGFFGAGAAPSVERLLALGSGGISKVFTLINQHLPEAEMPVVLVNDTKYGGAGYSNFSVASINASSAAIVEHEVGHSFAALTDEYESAYPGFTPTESYAANATAQTSRGSIKWNHWIDETTPVPTPASAPYNTAPSDGLVGLFQGAIYQTSGWYRPHFNSLMRSLNRPCGQVNREQFVLQFYNRVSPLDGFSPGSTTAVVTTPSPLSFEVTPKVPSSGVALNVTWRVDGVVQPGETGAQFETLSDFVGNGIHTVTATVQDPTSFVRLDTSNLLSESVTWNLTLSGQIPATLDDWRTTYGEDSAVSSPDQLANLIKYAFGRDATVPVTADQTPAGSMTSESGQKYLTLTVPRRMRRSDVTYTVQVSGDLSQWMSGPGHTVIVQDDETQLVVRDATPLSDGGQRFIRLAVQPLAP